ncbi:hypothetical protein HJFPF1_07377 [Paramyrothecium foliicola]|nr:hypothetical protein HJFPF1_07377 [Paramyrothecium foliicola]
MSTYQEPVRIGSTHSSIKRPPTSASQTWVTSYARTSSITPSPSPISGQDVIFLIAPIVETKKRSLTKRALGGFVSREPSQSITDCSTAIVFTLSPGQLFADGDPIYYAPGEGSKPFRSSGSSPPGAILATFSLAGRSLQFTNSELPEGRANFCQDALTGQVQITFTSRPLGCEPVSLTPYNGKPH